MKCEELLEALNAYVDGELEALFPADFCQEFQRHLEGCQPCRVVVDTLRFTVALYRNQEPYPLPSAFQERLRQILRQRWEMRGQG